MKAGAIKIFILISLQTFYHQEGSAQRGKRVQPNTHWEPPKEVQNDVPFSAPISSCCCVAIRHQYRLVMSIGNQEFGIPRKYQYQIGIWYLCLKFLGIFLVFYRNLEYDLVKSWLNIGILRQNKN